MSDFTGQLRITELKQLDARKAVKITQDIYACSMGKVFKVLAICLSDDEANEFCRKNKDCGVIATDSNGLIYIAEIYGKTIKSAVLKDFMGH